LPAGWTFGLKGMRDRLRWRRRTEAPTPDGAAPGGAVAAVNTAAGLDRRELLGHLLGLPLLGAWALAWLRRRGRRIASPRLAS